MAEIQFQSTVLKSFSRDHKGGKARFSSSLTVPVCKAMNWLNENNLPAISDFLTGAKPEGELHATSMTLKSKAGDLAEYEIEIAASKVSSFELVRRELEGKRGKGHRFDLLFDVAFTDLTACRYLEEYMTSAGDSKGTLVIRHEPKAQQQGLIPDDVTATEEQRQAVQ